MENIKPVKQSENYTYPVSYLEVNLEIDYKLKLYTVSLWDTQTKTGEKLGSMFTCTNDFDLNVQIANAILEAVNFAKGELSK